MDSDQTTANKTDWRPCSEIIARDFETRISLQIYCTTMLSLNRSKRATYLVSPIKPLHTRGRSLFWDAPCGYCADLCHRTRQVAVSILWATLQDTICRVSTAQVYMVSLYRILPRTRSNSTGVPELDSLYEFKVYS